MSKPITLHSQVHLICEEAAKRSQHVQKFKEMQARLEGFCEGLKLANREKALSVDQLNQRASILPQDGNRSLKSLFFIMQLVADLQAIEDLAKLRKETERLRQETALLEAKTSEYCTKIHQFNEKIILLDKMISDQKLKTT
jgi:hypothetical protein